MTHTLLRRSLLGLMLAFLFLVPRALRPTSTGSAASSSTNANAIEEQSPQMAATVFAGWQNLGKIGTYAANDPVIGQNQDGRLEIFAWGDYGTGLLEHSVYHRSQTTPNGSSWGAWNSLGTLAAGILQPSVARNPAGRMEAFVVGAVMGATCTVRNEIEQIWQTGPNGAWSSWTQMGAPNPSLCYDASEPYVGMNGDGRLDVFALNENGFFYHRWQTTPSGNWSTGWNGITGNPSGVSLNSYLTIGNNADGRLALFTTASDHEVYHAWQTTANDEYNWSWWTGFGKPSGISGLYYPALGRNQDGRLEIFALGSDLAIWHKWQVAPNSYWSSDWASMGSPSSATVYDKPKVIETPDGRLVLFAPMNDGAIWYKAQTQPNGTWGSWMSMGKPAGVSSLTKIAVARNQNGLLVVAALDPSGNLWWNHEPSMVYLPLLRR